MKPTFIFYNPTENIFLTYFYSDDYKMYLFSEQISENTTITVTQLTGRASFEARKEREKDKWDYIGQL